MVGMSLRKGHGQNPGSFTLWRRRAVAFPQQYDLVPTSLKTFVVYVWVHEAKFELL